MINKLKLLGEYVHDNEDDNNPLTIFIEYDDHAEQIWDNYQQVLEMKNGFKKNSDLKQARKNLTEYIFNIPNKCLPIGNNDGIYHLCKNQIKEFYDPITGFKLDKQLP
jgi:hypothetical protein